MRLLLAEDDPMIGEAVRHGLAQDGFAVVWVRDGHAAELALAEKVHELLLLDLGLPRKEGLAVLAAMRRGGDRRPVLVLTARDAVSDRVAGLDAGADDYLVKPFELAELGARIRALARRQVGRAEPRIELGSLAIDPASHEVSVDGEPLALSAREYALLEALAARPGAILSRSQLEERLYGWKEAVDSNAVDVHLSTLRRKLPPGTIRNVRGMGWMLPRPGTPA
jgi:two-component system response regulator QseB